MHTLLARQLRRHLSDEDVESDRFAPFIHAVNLAYAQFDEERERLERSLDLTSEELMARFDQAQKHIQERALIEQELQRSLTSLTATLDAIGEAIMVFDEHGALSLWNQHAIALAPSLQYLLKPQIDSVASVLSAQINESHVENFHKVFNSDNLDSVHGVFEFRDGAVVEYYCLPKFAKNSPAGWVWSFRNVTELRKKEHEIFKLAYLDPLTQLPNRRLLNDRIAQAIKLAEQSDGHMAILFVDMDGFKRVNDTLGHTIGDVVLKSLSERISDTLRKVDTLSRVGGDEFIILMESIKDQNAAINTALKILAECSRPISVQHNEISLSASIGISLYPHDGSSGDALLRAADLAMYHAKQDGKNTFKFFAADMERIAINRMHIEHQLRKALKNHEFELHFQPKITLSNGRISGCEALIRWKNANGEYIPPVDFIGVAEQSGLIGPIGAWVFEQACITVAKWRTQSLDGFSVAVNLSIRQLHDPFLPELASSLLSRYKIPNGAIEVEITETMLIEDFERAHDTLAALNRLGISVAIDDFGTGYSSLTYLTKMPIQCLKIDRSFICKLDTDTNSSAIAKTVVGLGKSLGMLVVAEGAESKACIDLLKNWGCEAVQGYFYSKPVPESAMLALLLAQPFVYSV